MTDSPTNDRVRSTGAPPVWHALTAEEARAKLGVESEFGLSSQDVHARLERYGANEIARDGGRGGWEIFLDQFGDVMLLMLIGVAIVSASLELYEGWQTGTLPFPKDAIAIFSIVLLNGLLGYLQESKAAKALAALRQLSAPRVRVLRDGDFLEIDSRRLVPGDLMFLEAGTQVSADGRLLEAVNLRIQESALTGEALAVGKRAEGTLAVDSPLGDRANCVFCGTETLQGRGKVLVTATGMDTELGKIAALIEGVESEPTPLQQRMTQLGQVLVTGAMALVVVVVVGGTAVLGWNAFRQLLEVSLSMAVAVVPEGLPAVITVTLALGTQRMVRRHALIRRLPAVETLGSVTTICSDKTGTLTQNKMVARSVVLPQASYQVTGEGYEPFGVFQPLTGENGAPGEAVHASILEQDAPDLQLLLVACVLCNDAVLQQAPATEGDRPGQTPWTILGDPTEGGLLSLAGKANIVQEVWTRHFPRVAEIPFSSERKRMSTFVQPSWPLHEELFHLWPLQSDPPPSYLMFEKGSPELVLQGCDRLQVGTMVREMGAAERERAMLDNERLASQGLRVLGFAYRPLQHLPHEQPGADLPDFDPERQLIWLGLVGAIDATRPEAKDAVRRCRQAGIRPILITGDHPLTARAIAEELEIAQPGDRILTGRELEKMGAAELESEVVSVPVYARVSPEHKLRIVKALQRQQQVVAMTGDGVNDAPALKQADIGIAMGITGTDVSKEAGDMVLLDDNFASIVAATEEGRVVYDNIRRFVKYILGSNIGEVIVIASAPLLLPNELIGGDLVPLTPLQILWMNLVTDGLPALALALEPATPDVMNRPPQHPNESIFARGLGSYMIRIGIVFAVFTIALMRWAYDYAQMTDHPDSWKTMVFTSLCIAQMGHALAVRSNTKLIVEMNLFSNPYVLWSVSVTTLLQLALVYVAPLRDFFGTSPLDGVELAVCLGMSALVLVWIEGEKLFVRWVWRRKGI